MSDRTYAKVQTQQKTLSGSSPKSSLLQRTCACGKHTIAGGECEACRSEQSTLLRSQRTFEPPSAPGAGPGSSLAQEHGTAFNSAFDSASRFGHDFSRIPIHSPAAGAIQTKLAISQPGDEYEQETDRISQQVMRMPEPQLQRACTCGGACPKCQTEQPGREHERLQTKHVQASDTGQIASPPIVHEVLRSPGQPLDPTTRAFMEPRFGHDFSGVRVHSDAAAEQSARDVNAHAYTVGHDIVFGAGQFLPGTQAGRWLLSHELTHVVQQGGGGAPLGPAQEQDADAVSRAVEMGARPQVRTRSRVGLAAQTKPGIASGALPEAIDPENAGLKIVTVSEIEAKVARILKAPGFMVAEGRKDFNASPRVAKANLYHTHFRNDDERLSYALGVFQQSFGNGVDPNELFATLLQYEIQVQRQSVDIVIHTPPTRAESQRLGELQAERERREYETYLAEVARLNEEGNKRLLSYTGVYSGAATLDPYEYFVGEPFKAVVKSIPLPDTKHMVSIMIDFIPIVGQVKTVAEAIIGHDLITWDKLPYWERGLNLLLAIIPEAHRIFSAGESGLRTLARIAVDSAKPADEVYLATKVASKLTVEEVQTVEKVVVGAPATSAQLKLAAKLEELPGVTAKSAAKAEAALTVKLAQLEQPIQLAGKKSHALSLKRIGNQLRVWLCSNGCGPLIEKAEAMLARLPKNHAARGELEAFINQVRTEATWIDVVPELEEAQEALKKFQQSLEEIQSRHPGAVDPDVPVTPAAPATTAEHAPVAEPAGAPAALGGDVFSRNRLSTRGLHPDETLGDQLGGAGQLSDVGASPNLKGVGGAELSDLTPRQLAQMVEDGKITKRVFNSIMKTGEDRKLGGR